MNTLKLFCTVYDPNTDRYRFDYSIFLGIAIGFLCLGGIGIFIIREWRTAK
jgi:protein SCO1/2